MRYLRCSMVLTPGRRHLGDNGGDSIVLTNSSCHVPVPPVGMGFGRDDKGVW